MFGKLFGRRQKRPAGYYWVSMPRWSAEPISDRIIAKWDGDRWKIPGKDHSWQDVGAKHFAFPGFDINPVSPE